MFVTLCPYMPPTCLLHYAYHFRPILLLLSQCVMSEGSFLNEPKTSRPKACEMGLGDSRDYSTTSSNCSITSSIHTSISPYPPHPLPFPCAPAPRRHAHAFHSSTDRLRCATSSALTDVSSAASASSNARAYSRKFRRIFRFFSFVSNEGGRGCHKNCLNLFSSRSSISCPRTSQT